MYSNLSHDKVEYTHMAPLHNPHGPCQFEMNFVMGYFLFKLKLDFQILKLDLRFEINEYSRYRSFGQNLHSEGFGLGHKSLKRPGECSLDSFRLSTCIAQICLLVLFFLLQNCYIRFDPSC